MNEPLYELRFNKGKSSHENCILVDYFKLWIVKKIKNYKKRKGLTPNQHK